MVLLLSLKPWSGSTYLLFRDFVPRSSKVIHLTPVDRNPVPRVEVGPERFGDQQFFSRSLRPLQFVEMRELRPGYDGIPQPLGRLPAGRIDENRPEETLSIGKTGWAPRSRRHRPPAGGRPSPRHLSWGQRWPRRQAPGRSRDPQADTARPPFCPACGPPHEEPAPPVRTRRCAPRFRSRR